MLNSQNGSVAKYVIILLSVTAVLFLTWAVVILIPSYKKIADDITQPPSVLESKNVQNGSGIYPIAPSPQGIDSLTKTAISNNDISICDKFKFSGPNIGGLSEAGVPQSCKKNFSLALRDKNNQETLYTNWRLGTMTYSAPESWRPSASYKDKSCFGGGCPRFHKVFSDWGTDSYFIYFTYVKDNTSPDDVFNYISGRYPSINSITTINASSTEVFFIEDPKGKYSDFIFVKDDKIFDLQYSHLPIISSPFDKERILHLISSIRTVTDTDSPKAAGTEI